MTVKKDIGATGAYGAAAAPDPPFGADQLFALPPSARTQIDHYVCRGLLGTAAVQWADPFRVVEFR